MQSLIDIICDSPRENRAYEFSRRGLIHANNREMQQNDWNLPEIPLNRCEHGVKINHSIVK